MEKKPHIARSTGKYNWITPSYIIEAARNTMGGIDLDPASNYQANEIVQARRILTETDNALDPNTKWYSMGGRLWINPPYKQPEVRLFAERLLQEIRHGNVRKAIWISNNSTETKYGQMLLDRAEATCFPRKRIKFINPDTMQPDNTPLQGQMIIGLGNINMMRFEMFFEDMGVIIYPKWPGRYNWGRLSY